MDDPGNPTDPTGESGSEPDPDQPGWASPTPPPPAEPPPPPTPVTVPPAAEIPPPPTPTPQPTWGTTPAAAVPPPPVVPGAPVAGGPSDPSAAWTQVGAAPAPKKRRLTWLWILIPVLLVFIGATAVAITFGVKILVGPVDATNEYYAGLHDQNYSAAYEHLCAPLQDRYTESQFVDLQHGDEQSYGQVTSYSFDNSDIRNSRAYTTGTVSRSSSRTRRYEVTLVKEDGDWKVCGIRQR